MIDKMLREEIIAKVMKSGVPREDASLAIEMAEHAVRESVARLENVASSVPKHLYAHTVTIATFLLRDRITEISEGLVDLIIVESLKNKIKEN